MQTVDIKDARIPVLGYGTYGMAGADIRRMLPAALKAGFRHIDTAQIYRNEGEVGEVVAASRIARDELFITTKVWVENYSPRTFAASVDASLRKLYSDHIDLLLLHWPNDSVPLADQIGALNAVAEAGKVRHIGVSNFNKALMAQAIALSKRPLVTNQFEYHPYLNQSGLIDATRRAGQIVLRWLIQQDGVVALSRTTNEARLAENLGVFDFELDVADMQAIHRLARPGSRIVNPMGLAPLWDETPAHAV
jgi:diketogulonate reductase-like aldo/keto reductase